ncbi:MAG: zinc ribbon domain-containing protein, partial [Candidatus Micrarchaeaceae archaeon]
GVGISDYASMEYNYSTLGKAVNFTLTAESLVVVVQDGGNLTEPGSGIAGLNVAATALGSPYDPDISISYAYLAAGKYQFEPNKVTPYYGVGITGIFTFYGNSTTVQQNDIIFHETGLQKGDQWAVTFETTTGYEVYSSMPSGLPPSNESIVITDVAPGTYRYFVGMAQNNGGTPPFQMENITTGYHISPSRGTINFNGSVTYINVTFTPLAYYETDPIGGNYSSLDISSNSYMTSNLYITGNITISAGVTLYTDGYSILATGSFLNYGTIITGWPYNGGNSTVPTPISYPDSYGGSGGGSDTHDRFTIPGGNGGSTIAAGGKTVFATYAGNGGTPAPPALNNSMLETMYRDGFQNYLTGAGGGFAYGWGALNGGSGAYGLYVQANRIVAGDIYAYGLQDANISDMQNGGGGGGGVIILAYGDGGYTPGNYDISGGISTDMQTGSASGGGSGGNGQVVTYYYSNSPPIAIRAPLTYTVTFTESGLPLGTTWYVTLNGSNRSSVSNVITFTVPNGEYSYAIGNVPGYSSSPSSGTIVINGSPDIVSINFIRLGTLTLILKERGLPIGTKWSIGLIREPEYIDLPTIFSLVPTSVTGLEQGSMILPNELYIANSSGSQAVLNLNRGYYQILGSNLSNYIIDPEPGCIDLTSQNASVNITFVKSNMMDQPWFYDGSSFTYSLSSSSRTLIKNETTGLSSLNRRNTSTQFSLIIDNTSSPYQFFNITKTNSTDFLNTLNNSGMGEYILLNPLVLPGLDLPDLTLLNEMKNGTAYKWQGSNYTLGFLNYVDYITRDYVNTVNTSYAISLYNTLNLKTSLGTFSADVLEFTVSYNGTISYLHPYDYILRENIYVDRDTGMILEVQNFGSMSLPNYVNGNYVFYNESWNDTLTLIKSSSRVSSSLSANFLSMLEGDLHSIPVIVGIILVAAVIGTVLVLTRGKRKKELKSEAISSTGREDNAGEGKTLLYHCKSCGKELQPDETFCPECGTRRSS